MNSRSQIRCYKPAFVLQRYFCTFVANPSDSISDVVIQMHFLSLYKGRICVYSTRTDFKRNSYTNSYTKILFGSRQIFKNPEFFSQNRKSYTNSYTYSYTRFSALGKIYKIFKIGHSDSYRQDFKVAGSIKFENLIAGSCKTVIHIVIQKSGQNTKKPQQNHFYCGFVVVSPGIEPGTQGFSVLCSTN